MGRLIDRPPPGLAERLAAERLGIGGRRGDPRHYNGYAPGFGFWKPSGVVVPTDGPNSWYRPTSAAHFTALGLNTPDLLHLCQEASGAMVPTIDGLSVGNWSANATGHVYQQTVTGWTCKFIGFDGLVANQRFASTSAALNLAAGESCAMIMYMANGTASADTSRSLLMAGTNNALIMLGTNGKARFRLNSLSVTSAGTHSQGITTVNMFGIYRRADTDVSGLETNLETGLTVTHDESAFTGELKGIGTANTSPPPESRYCWVAVWKGTNAEFSMSSYITTLKH